MLPYLADSDEFDFADLESFLARVPGIRQPLGRGVLTGGGWWVKFGLDIAHDLAWSVVQEFAHVLNYISVDERLPTLFMPVSPPSYLNGGLAEFLSWVIECKDSAFTPSLPPNGSNRDFQSRWMTSSSGIRTVEWALARSPLRQSN